MTAQEDWKLAGFGLYVHWPFCQAKCPYCDFNSHVSAAVDQTRWLDAYLGEIDRIGSNTGGRLLKSVFFGGGTPSLMNPDIVAKILERVRKTWTVANDWEVTLEANPSSVEAGRFAGYRDGGVNRVSLGIQALNDSDLRRLGRLHSVADARKALDIAKACMDRISFDLIYARQDQTPDDWGRELTAALALKPDHLSLYQLTIEDGTVFFDRFSKGLLRGLPDEDRSVDLYEITQNLCEDDGLPAYEVSNHGRPGAESRHNLLYWQGGDYAGIGPGAHGRLSDQRGRWATECIRSPQDWLRQVTMTGNGETSRQLLLNQARAEEVLIMGMRLAAGIRLDRLLTMSGLCIERSVIDDLTNHSLVVVENNTLRTTKSGRLLLNLVIERLADGLQPQSLCSLD